MDNVVSSVEELRAQQLERLRWSLRHAYDNVPHYRAAFDAAGVHPDDVRGLPDLGRFPFTAKADLRDNYPFGMFAVPREQVSRIHASSGTTGKPTVVGYTREDIDTWAEVMGPGVSQESGETQDGLHIWEDHFYPEVVDPITGEVLPDGEEGELVFTSLTKQAMPVVRYRTRDLTTLLPGTAYPAFRRMQKVTGRTDDMMIVRGVNVFPSQIEEQILSIEGLTPHYLCVLTRPGNLDELTVRVEHAPDVPDPQALEVLGARLRDRIKHRIGVTTRVDVVEPYALERSLGKAKRISDQRPR